MAGTEGWKLGEDGKLPVVEENGINTVNLNYQMVQAVILKVILSVVTAAILQSAMQTASAL